MHPFLALYRSGDRVRGVELSAHMEAAQELLPSGGGGRGARNLHVLLKASFTGD